jgi:hypothetical protein
MSEYRIEAERVLEPLRGDYWSAIFGMYEDDRRIQEIEVRLSFRALGVLCEALRHAGIEPDPEGVAGAVLWREGERRIREQLAVRGRCEAEILLTLESLDKRLGGIDDVLYEAGLL